MTRQIMNIPNLPVDNLTDTTGYMSVSGRTYFDQLTTQLQQNLGNGRYRLPSQTTESIERINNLDTSPAIVHDSTAQNVKVNTNGNYQTVVTYDGSATTAQINAIPSGQRNGRVFWDTDVSKIKFGANDTFIVLS